MPTAALLNNPKPEAVRTCAACRWSRDAAGELFMGTDRAYCGQPDVKSDDGKPVPCERHRFAKASSVLRICGEAAIFWEPR